MSMVKGDIFTTAHLQAINRANDGYGYLTGCDVHEQTPAAMGVTVDSGTVIINGVYTTVAGGNLSVGASDPTNPRFDIIYVNSSGTAAVVAGTAAVIAPTGETAYKKMITPYPNPTVPTGVILAIVYVAAGATSILNASINDIASYAGQVATGTLTTRGDLPFRDANGWARLAKSVTTGHSLLQGANDPYWGYPDHTTLSNIGTNAHSVIDSFITSKAQASGLASLDASSVCVQEPKLHASRHESGGADAIKLDNLSAPDNNTDLNASTSAHGLMQIYPNTKQRLLGDASWATPTFGLHFEFGDGSALLVAQAKTVRVPIASKINKAYIRSLDTDGALKSGSIRIDIYVHDYNAAIGSSVDDFSLSTASSFAETGLNSSNGWTVTAGKFVTAIISGITTCEQIAFDLELEAT
jgi:hypothetical protein